MSNRTPLRVSGKAVNSAHHAAAWIKDYGVIPVPLYPKSKKPKGEKGKGLKGWTDLRVTVDTASQFFSPNDNIGGLWGEPSNWIVDIDLDIDEAARAARILLPETLMYGRKSSPGSHYLFRCENAVTRQYSSKEIGMIAELRSTGAQSVLPPSIHPCGERFRFEHETEIAEIGLKTLESKMKLIAAAATIAHYYPNKGARHNYVHAVCGALLWSGWETAPIKEFMKAVFLAGRDSDEEMEDRNGSVKNTIEHFKKGDRVSGWPSLSEHMPGLDMINLKKWLNLSNRVPDNSEVAPDSIEAEHIPDIKPKLLSIPGLVGDIAKWASKQSYTKQPLFDIATGLLSVALASGNRYVVAGWNTPLQPYIMMLAPTASGKEFAMELVMDIATRIGLKNNVFSGFQSFHSLLDILAKPPHTLCWHWDEAARKLRTAGRSQGGPDYQILTYLLQLYGKANKTVPGLPGRKNAIEAIDRPFFTVLAAAQPSQLLEAITASDLSLGLINRFLLLDAGHEMARTNEFRDDTFPSAISTAIEAMQKIKPKGGEFIEVGFDGQESYEIFNDFQVAARESAAKEEGKGEMWGRANQNALLYAGIVAVGINPKLPKITQEIAQWAVEFVSWSVERWIIRIEQSSSRSVTEQASKNIERLIRSAKGLKHLCKNDREVSMIEKGKMPRALLTRLTRHLKARDLDDVITSLIMSDLIGTSEELGVDCYWIKQRIK